MHIYIDTIGGDEVIIEATLSKAVAITLAACIAEGIVRGAEHCLPKPHHSSDVELFEQLLPEVVDIVKRIVDSVNKIP